MKECNGRRIWTAVMAAGVFAAGVCTAGSLDPTNGPGPTMHTLEEIYGKLGSIGRTLSATTTVVDAGFYDATSLAAVDPDLTAANIATNKTIFGIVGTLLTSAPGSEYPAPVARTGQTATVPLNPAPAGADGALQKGVAWPNPRFIDNANGTVTDDLTGLIWLKDANAFGGMVWTNALTACNTLNSGEHGLTDSSAEGDWRLPNINELFSLLDFRYMSPALPNTTGTGKWTAGDPFAGVQSASTNYYWSSTVDPYGANRPYTLSFNGLGYGIMTSRLYHSATNSVWPVRGP